MANISRLKTAEISNGNVINADDIAAELDQLVNAHNTQETTISDIQTGSITISGDKTFSGDNIHSGTNTLSGTFNVTGHLNIGKASDPSSPAEGIVWYNTTGNTFKYSLGGGTVRNILSNASGIDDLSDVTISGATSGQALVYNGSAWVNGTGGTEVLIETKTASASSSITFTTGINNTYKSYILRIFDAKPATDSVNLMLRVSEDAGSNWKTTAGDYSYANYGLSDSSSLSDDFSASSTAIILCKNIGNSTNESASGHIYVLDPSATGTHKKTLSDINYVGPAAELFSTKGYGRYKSTTNAVNGFQLLMSSGNITSGEFRLYGIR